jgi:hypothetical protein
MTRQAPKDIEFGNIFTGKIEASILALHRISGSVRGFFVLPWSNALAGERKVLD